MNLFIFPFEVWDKRNRELVCLVQAPDLAGAIRDARKFCHEHKITDDPADIFVCMAERVIECTVTP